MGFFIIFTILVTFLVLEIYGYKKYKNSVFVKKNLFIPHFFCHYILNPSYKSKKINISPNNFRIYQNPLTNSPDIYLSGDCNFFEQDLNLDETLGFFLEKNNKKVLNPSCPHYTNLHQFNRFIFDLKHDVKPKKLIFSAHKNFNNFKISIIFLLSKFSFIIR